MKKMTAWLLAGILSVNMMAVPVTAAVDDGADEIDLQENEVQEISLEEQPQTEVSVEEEAQEETQEEEQEEVTGFSSGDLGLEMQDGEETQPEYEEGDLYFDCHKWKRSAEIFEWSGTGCGTLCEGNRQCECTDFCE